MVFLWSTNRHAIFITILIAYVLRSPFDTRVCVFYFAYALFCFGVTLCLTTLAIFYLACSAGSPVPFSFTVMSCSPFA